MIPQLEDQKEDLSLLLGLVLIFIVGAMTSFALIALALL